MATGTASGKTLVYNAAFAETAITTPKATALYLFPTKALARDQLRSVRALKLPQVKAAVYDGDTPKAERPLIRTNANLVMTNPDMLHLSLLADHARWADFFLRLSLVVVDEAHVCRGVFGSHVAMVLRRLRRLVAHYGGTPAVVPRERDRRQPAASSRRRLTGLDDVVEVTDDASPCGREALRPVEPAARRRGDRRAAERPRGERLAHRAAREPRAPARSASRGSRRAAELLAEWARREVGDAQLRQKITSYRAGYLAEDRRRIERALADGELLAVASTSALELGIDIGSLDAAVLTGYPGTRAAMWQQAGRAGRRDTDSLAVLVAQDDPLDQYLVHHPEDLFDKPAGGGGDRPHEPVRARAAPALRGAGGAAPRRRARVLRRRGRGARLGRGDDRARRAGAAPRGLARSRQGRAPPRGRRARRRRPRLLDRDRRHRRAARARPTSIGPTPRCTRARCTCTSASSTWCRSSTSSRASRVVRSADPDFYTQARDVTDIAVGEILARSTYRRRASSAFGSVRVTNQVVSYVRKSVSTNETLDEVPLPLPPVELETRAVWWTIPPTVLDRAGGRSARRARRDPRGRARRDRAAAARRDLRPLGHRRRLDADAPRHRPHDDLHLRRLPGRRRHRRARRRDQRAMAPRDARGDPRSARARTDARAACRARSAATATSRSTSRGPWRCWPRSSGSAGASGSSGRLRRCARRARGSAGASCVP